MNSLDHALSTRQLATMPSCPVPCPFCGRPFKVGLEGWFCPDPVHCGHWTWCLPDEAVPAGQVAA
jgi:hypothetical protein